MLMALVCYWGMELGGEPVGQKAFVMGNWTPAQVSMETSPASVQVFYQPSFRLSLQAPSGGLVCAQLCFWASTCWTLAAHYCGSRASSPRARCQVFQHLLPGISHTPLKGPVFPSPALKIGRAWIGKCGGGAAVGTGEAPPFLKPESGGPLASGEAAW